MLRVRISRRRPRGVPGVTSFEVLVGGYISIEFDVLIPSSCFVFLLHAAMTSMWFSYALGYLPLLVSVGGTCMHECTDIVAERQQDDFKFSLLCSHLHLSTILDLFLSIHLFSGNCHLFAVYTCKAAGRLRSYRTVSKETNIPAWSIIEVVALGLWRSHRHVSHRREGIPQCSWRCKNL
jgi:hypothetical protein